MDPEVRQSVVPTVVDMSFDDSDEEVAMAGNRFAALGDHHSDQAENRPSRRRLVLVSQVHDVERASDHEWDADTDSIPGASDVEVGDEVEPTAEEIPVVVEPRVRAVGGAFASLDVVNISEVFDRRPKAESLVRATRGWKLFLLFPRMLLFRPARGGLVPRKQLEARFKSFHDGHWIQLLNESAVSSEMSHTLSVRRRRRAQYDDDESKRVARAMSLSW